MPTRVLAKFEQAMALRLLGGTHPRPAKTDLLRS